MFERILGAIAIVLVIEGLLPLLNPSSWRQMFSRILELTDGQLRFVGLASVAAGALLWMVSAG